MGDNLTLKKLKISCEILDNNYEIRKTTALYKI